MCLRNSGWAMLSFPDRAEDLTVSSLSGRGSSVTFFGGRDVWPLTWCRVSLTKVNNAVGFALRILGVRIDVKTPKNNRYAGLELLLWGSCLNRVLAQCDISTPDSQQKN